MLINMGNEGQSKRTSSFSKHNDTLARSCDEKTLSSAMKTGECFMTYWQPFCHLPAHNIQAHDVLSSFCN